MLQREGRHRQRVGNNFLENAKTSHDVCTIAAVRCDRENMPRGDCAPSAWGRADQDEANSCRDWCSNLFRSRFFGANWKMRAFAQLEISDQIRQRRLASRSIEKGSGRASPNG